MVTKDGAFKPVLLNAITMLRHAPEWQGVLGFNEFSLHTVTLNPAPWPQSTAGKYWSDDNDVRAAEWLQHKGIFVPSNVAAEAAQAIAKEHRFHPVRDYINQLHWDGMNSNNSAIKSLTCLDLSQLFWVVLGVQEDSQKNKTKDGLNHVKAP